MNKELKKKKEMRLSAEKSVNWGEFKIGEFNYQENVEKNDIYRFKKRFGNL